MTPLSLRLRGFRGIHDGLGLDEVFLDLQALPSDAQLVAIAGANGKGKSTLMDNLHPYLVMPSRAGADGLGAFSYYDQLCASEAEKELVWEHAGHRYRTHLVFRVGARRKTEAFLLEEDGGSGWRPLILADGTVSDGKTDTYERCLEAVMGSAQTFFTSVFSAQGKRQFSALRNSEVKTLLADLLCLNDIRETGQRANEIVRLLRVGILTLRQERGTVAAEQTRAQTVQANLGDAAARVNQARTVRAAAAEHLTRSQTLVSQLTAKRDSAAAHQQRRNTLLAERAAAATADEAADQAQRDATRRELQRQTQIAGRAAQRPEQSNRRRHALAARRQQIEGLLSTADRVACAVRCVPLARKVVEAWQQRRDHWAREIDRLKDLQRQDQTHAQHIASIEREAGQASLRIAELNRRLGLSQEVPCTGTDLQGRCQLLSDAREAQQLKPSADAALARLGQERNQAQAAQAALQASMAALVDAPLHLAHAERRLVRVNDRAQRLIATSRHAEALTQARTDLDALQVESQQIEAADTESSVTDTREQQETEQALATIEALGRERKTRHAAQLARVDADLAGLPAPFDSARLTAAQAQAEQAAKAVQNAEAAQAQAAADCREQEMVRAHLHRLVQQLAELDERTKRAEAEASTWSLLAKALSPDGIIALCIDDAGPSLSGFANDLLLSCYGPRFTVSIRTLLETAKGESREGFDIVVHDANSGQSKSVSPMSGGERVWINECLVRAVALHLSETSGRRYATLFSDEADGSLDPERKRMFMAMKREVLRLGGYEREYFISQTPELTAQADAVIDMDELAHSSAQRHALC